MSLSRLRANTVLPAPRKTILAMRRLYRRLPGSSESTDAGRPFVSSRHARRPRAWGRGSLGRELLQDGAALLHAEPPQQDRGEERAGNRHVEDPAVVAVVRGPGEQPADQQARPDDGAEVAHPVGPSGSDRTDSGR